MHARHRELREVADLYFARFDARLEKGLAEVRAELAIRAEVDKRFAEMNTRLADQRADLLRWMFAFWLGTILPLAGLMVALKRL